MSYWLLTIKRPFAGEETFDLRTQPRVFVGDDLSNDICVHTIQIPGRLLLVEQTLTKRVRVRITNEISSSMRGEFTKKKDWKSPLYQGSIFEINGDADWKIGDAEFRLTKKEKHLLAPLPRETETLQNKHWRQSVGSAAGIHILAFILFYAFSFISNSPRLSDQEIKPSDIQKVSILQVKKAFEVTKAEIPPNLEVAKPEEAQTLGAKSADEAKEIEKSEELAALSPKANEVTKASTHLKAKTRGVSSKLASQKATAPVARNIETMGLLAIQSTAKPKKTNLNIGALALGAAQNSNVSKKARAGLGLAKGEADFGILGVQKGGEQVAQLDGVGVESYQGGLGEKVRRGSLKGASIKLIRREVEIRGGLDPAVIRQIIEERLSEVRYCYETALLKQTNLQGKISATWTIQPDGSVSALTSESEEIKTSILHPCIKDQIKNWKFPAPKGGGVVHVKYPFLFSPVGS